MPELPEVETIKRDLEKVILNKTITAVSVYRPAIIKEPLPEEFVRTVTNTVCQSIVRRGKLLVIELVPARGRHFFLTIHLKMSGQLVYGSADPKSRVRFNLSDGNCFSYNDQRAFGELRAVQDWRTLSVAATMGPEPLAKDFTAEKFIERLRQRSTRIKPLLLDQKFIAGIGNIYAAEALFLSRIDPARKADDLNRREAKVLLSNIRKVLEKAIRCRGSSVNTYRDGRGQKGAFTRHLLVYGRKGEACYQCHEPVQKTALGGRGTYFCGTCQK